MHGTSHIKRNISLLWRGNKSHSKASLWLIQSKAHPWFPCRKVSVVVYGPPEGVFSQRTRSQLSLSDPRHWGAHTAWLLDTPYTCAGSRAPRLANASAASFPKLCPPSASPRWQHREQGKGWEGRSFATPCGCLLGAYQRGFQSACYMFEKLPRNCTKL